MKTLLVMIALLSVSSLHAATTSAKVLGEIDIRIEMQRDALNEKLNNLDADDLTKGKIIASMVNMIEEKLVNAESLEDAISSDEDLTVENVDKINSVLDLSEELIKEL
jgi:hypothetical protein